MRAPTPRVLSLRVAGRTVGRPIVTSMSSVRRRRRPHCFQHPKPSQRLDASKVHFPCETPLSTTKNPQKYWGFYTSALFLIRARLRLVERERVMNMRPMFGDGREAQHDRAHHSVPTRHRGAPTVARRQATIVADGEARLAEGAPKARRSRPRQEYEASAGSRTPPGASSLPLANRPMRVELTLHDHGADWDAALVVQEHPMDMNCCTPGRRSR